jgi:hypothetical protein
MAAVGDELIDSIVGDNIPIFTEEEKYNQTVTSSVERLEAQLNGREVPGERPGGCAAARRGELGCLPAAGAAAVSSLPPLLAHYPVPEPS